MVALLAGKGLALAAGKPLIAVNHLEGHALSPAAGRSGPRISLSAAARVGRPLPAARSARRRRLPAAGDDHRRCRGRGVRQGRQAARPCLSRRPGDRGAGGERRSERRAAAAARWSARASRISRSPASRARFSARSLSGDFRPEDIAASFQQAVVDCLVDRTRAGAGSAATRRRWSSPAGVAANQAIRGALAELAKAEGRRFSVPPAWLCTDNAAMIAWAGAERFAAGDVRSARRAGAGALAARREAPRRCAARG